MSTGVRIPLGQADAIAQSLVTALAPACERIAVAGSIRRGRPDIGDIEIVATSRSRTESVPGLLYETKQQVDELAVAIDHLVADGILVRLAGGDRYTKLQHVDSGLQVDLFVVSPPAHWGVIYLIRTGPAAYSQWLVTEARRRGFHVVDGQLHRGSLGCSVVRSCDVVPTPEELHVYQALSLPFMPAERRG